MQQRLHEREEFRACLADRQPDPDSTRAARSLELGDKEVQALLQGAAPGWRGEVVQAGADDADASSFGPQPMAQCVNLAVLRSGEGPPQQSGFDLDCLCY